MISAGGPDPLEKTYHYQYHSPLARLELWAAREWLEADIGSYLRSPATNTTGDSRILQLPSIRFEV